MVFVVDGVWGLTFILTTQTMWTWVTFSTLKSLTSKAVGK
jgi:hypothetical protein